MEVASPTQDAAYSLAALSSPTTLSAESICPIETLQFLIDDYFYYIHPLVPLPHEPTFRAAFANREDRTDRTFLALIAAMIGALVASFPRKPLLLFTSNEARKEFPNAGTLIDRSHQVYLEARGTDFLDRDLTIYDAAGSYLTGLSAAYMFDIRRCRFYFAECVIVLRTLDLHKAEHDQTKENDCISREMARRLFFICFVGSQSVRQLGSTDIVMLPLMHADKFPPLPLEVDDAYIFATHVASQPEGIVSELTGFNLNVHVFRAYSSLTALETAFGNNELYDWDKQRKLISQALRNVKSATDNAPPELRLNPSPADGMWPTPLNVSLYNSHDGPWSIAGGLDGSSDPPVPSYSKRETQYEIQKANIYASQLGTRSFLVEKYWNLYELQDRHSTPHILTYAGSPTIGCFSAGVDARIQARTPSDAIDVGEQAMAIEREDIVRDLSTMLQSINQVNMEPNGLSIVSLIHDCHRRVAKIRLNGSEQCHKIRQIASTLLHVPRSRMAMPSLDSESVNLYLTDFLDILMRLERVGSSRFSAGVTSSALGNGNGVLSAEEVEQSELVHWASLKEHQEKFARANGFVTGL